MIRVGMGSSAADIKAAATHLIPSTVNEVSAMLVETIHFLESADWKILA